MSDNEHPLPILGNSEILAVKHLPLEVIPQPIKRSDDGMKCLTLVVWKQSFDVLKQQKTGSFILGDPADLEEESSPCVLKSSSLSSDRESLARKSSAEQFEVG
jgi:hypothetical protein